MGLVEAIRGVLTDETIFLIDGSNIGQWAHVLFWDRYPGHWLTCGASVVVGWAYPAPIGAKLLHPARPVLLLSGDGAIGFTITELETAVHHRYPIVVVVADDEAWGIVAGDQRHSGVSRLRASWARSTTLAWLRASGRTASPCHRSDQLAPAIREALASGQPTLIEVPIALRAPTD